MDAPAARLAQYSTVAATLSSLSDAELIATLGPGDRGLVSIGGVTHTILVAGTPVFVKLIRLTDRERDAGSGCTANLFDLPVWYQYGVGEGSTGFNAWREVAGHQIVSDWVRQGECANFPLLYHWRELPWPPDPAPRAADLGRAVTFWNDSPAVATRLRALADSSTVVALFLEQIPFVMRDWLPRQLTAGPAEADAAVTLVERQLLGAVEQLRSAGMSHFDTHFDNILTDGRRLYVSDFGLATALRFQLSASEIHFFRLTADHDLAYSAGALVNTIVGTLVGFSSPRERNGYVQRCAETGQGAHLTGRPADTVVRYAGVAAVVNDFYWHLHGGEVTAHEYPAEAIAAALRDAGVATHQR